MFNPWRRFPFLASPESFPALLLVVCSFVLFILWTYLSLCLAQSPENICRVFFLFEFLHTFSAPGKLSPFLLPPHPLNIHSQLSLLLCLDSIAASCPRYTPGNLKQFMSIFLTEQVTPSSQSPAIALVLSLIKKMICCTVPPGSEDTGWHGQDLILLFIHNRFLSFQRAFEEVHKIHVRGDKN